MRKPGDSCMFDTFAGCLHILRLYFKFVFPDTKFVRENLSGFSSLNYFIPELKFCKQALICIALCNLMVGLFSNSMN